jgi:hypothetical protein
MDLFENFISFDYNSYKERERNKELRERRVVQKKKGAVYIHTGSFECNIFDK